MDKNKIRIDYLKNHPDYKVCQHVDMYHFNTDTCLLGEFIKINKGESVLDVGTNNGALLVYIIKKGGIASGIEINKDAIEVANMTLEINNMKATLINYDFTLLDESYKYDVIVSNPPYFNSSESEKNDDYYKKIARHEGTLTLETLTKSLATHLNKNGRIYLVYRYDRFKELEDSLNKYGLFINNYQLAIEKTHNVIKSVLVEATTSNNNKNKLEDIYI